ncbi:MAG: helix-turn-helix domain-containing protein [Candidatus Methylomirabilales bacterium]
MGVSRACAYKWLKRWREEGVAGLQDRSSAPRSCPHALPPDEVARIVEMRKRLRFGPHRLAYATGRHRSTRRRDRGVREDSRLTPRFLPVHPTGQFSRKCPQVEGHVVCLSARHAKLRRDGYRRDVGR